MVTETQPVERQSQELAQQAEALAASIKTREDYQSAGEIRNAIKLMMDKVVAHHKPTIDAATATLEAARAARDSLLTPLKESDRLLMTARASWADEQKRLEDEKRRTEEAERRKKALEEAEALRKKLEAEAALVREQNRIKQEEEKLAQVDLASEFGATEERLEEILNTPVAPPVAARTQSEIDAIVEATAVSLSAAPAAKPTAPAVRYRYGARCDDIFQLAKAVVAGLVPVTALQANQPALNALAVASKEQFNVPGCTLVKTPIDNRRTV
jgi:hypothetical protein